MQATTWADTVDFKEARKLLANPRKLAQRLDKLPKEGEPPPEPGMKVETPLHELPGIRPSPRSKDKREKLQTDSALITNVVKARAYELRKIRVKDDPQENGDFLETLKDSQRIPVFLLEAILRYRHERQRNPSARAPCAKKVRKKNRASNFRPQ